jgi:hypothetical protein
MRLLNQIEAQRCRAWAAAAVHGDPAPAARPTVVRRPAEPPAEAAEPPPDLHSASIATPPAPASTRRRRAAHAVAAGANGVLPPLAILAAEAAKQAGALHSPCNLQS